MDSGSQQQFLVLVVLIIVSGFFSMSETALISLSRMRLRNMVDEGKKNAALVDKLLQKPQKLLSSILVGNNLANTGVSTLSAAVAMQLVGNNSMALGIATGIATFLILVFSEITPKTFANQHAESISLLVSKPIAAITWVLTPVLFVLDLITSGLLRLVGSRAEKQPPVITESELKTIVNVSHEEGVLEGDERQMIHNVVDFGDCHAKDIMLPRIDIVAVQADAAYDEILSTFRKEGFSRIPVYEETIDDIIGVLHLRDVVFYDGDPAAFKAAECMREAFFTYESKPTRELFNEMRASRVSFAIVLDEYGGTSGIVTIEDLIEEIVGEIEDEYDDEDEGVQKVKENEYLVDGSIRIADLNEQIGMHIESEDFESIGGYVTGIIGHIPEENETVESGNVRFVIEKLEKNRIEKLRIYTLGGGETEKADG